MKDFGVRLREYRKQRGWSRINLAMFTNISPSTLKSWELGLRVPEIKTQNGLFEQMDTLGLPSKRISVPHAKEAVEVLTKILEITEEVMDKKDGV